MARELKIGDRVVTWWDEAGTVLSVNDNDFTMRYDTTGLTDWWGWVEFNANDPSDIIDPQGTFRFEDTEYPEWPR